jgi:hypothetical protein
MAAAEAGLSVLPKILRGELQAPASGSTSGDLIDHARTIWAESPASNWLEASSIGNGHIGAMVFGGTTDEQLMLNEETLNAEEPGVRNPLDITEDYKTVRDLLQNEQYKEANDLVSREWLGRALVFVSASRYSLPKDWMETARCPSTPGGWISQVPSAVCATAATA